MRMWWTGRDKCSTIAIGRWKIKNSFSSLPLLPLYPPTSTYFLLSLSLFYFILSISTRISRLLRSMQFYDLYTSIRIRTGHFPVPFATVAIAFAYKRTITYELRLFLPPDRMVNFNEKIPPIPDVNTIRRLLLFPFEPCAGGRNKSIVIKRRF